MVYPLDALVMKKMQNLCNDHRFASKGQVFFRLHADTILQAISFRYERTFSHYSLNIGLMSLYSEAENSLFSARSALPHFSICCLENRSSAVSLDREHEFVSFSVRSPEEQLCLLEKCGFEWLDGVVTQEHLLCAMNFLDNVSYKTIIWNNEFKLAPFLAIGDYYSADLVIASILDQQLGPCSFSPPPWNKDDYLYYSTHFPNKNEDLLHLHKLIANKNKEAINTYLEENYQKNAERLHFLRR